MSQNFASLAADNSQGGNPAGSLKIVPILAKNFNGNWPIEADITAGEITVAPRLPANTLLPVYEIPVNTIDINSETVGPAGFHSEKHMVEFMTAGFSKTITAELRKYTNAGAVFLFLTPDLKWGVAGTSYKPIFASKSQKFGKKGGEQRGTTLKGEEEGYLWGIVNLADSVVSELDFAAAQVPA
ncbi:hypothetical protein [Emticicia sp. W12TSBA100-4]|uniref:hypothetical protein n=1 Tax=Emticicia sp. W12TSBA100-4 TaxID=3160965 RepID=UPI0033056486